jgi:hypothetical protein
VRRFTLRLVSLLSLGAYLLANTPASFALDYWVSSQIRANSITRSAPSEKNTPKPRKCGSPPNWWIRSAGFSPILAIVGLKPTLRIRNFADLAETRKCKHCNSVRDEVQGAPSSQSKQSSTPCPPCNDSSCPCSPGEHRPKDCPCPGGCAFCSVAKAPCMTPLTPTLCDAACVGECNSEEPFDYVSPRPGSLIRPPRA